MVLLFLLDALILSTNPEALIHFLIIQTMSKIFSQKKEFFQNTQT